MMHIVLIGVSAGAAAALLFASVASGSALSIPLFYLAPLPILIAAVGWSPLAGLVAALVAAAALAAALGSLFFLGFLLGVGLPAWWLGYLALLARPAADGAAALEWYPVGRIVLWAAILAGVLVTVGVLSIGGDLESFRAGLRGTLERMLPQNDPAARRKFNVPGAGELDSIDLIALIAPATAAVAALLTNTVSLWLAGKVVAVSGRLRRPWPDLAAMTFPPHAHLLLVGALAGTFLSGLAGLISGVFAASLMMAYGLLGLAVLHAVTRGRSARGFILGSVYGAIFVFGWPLILMSFIGLADVLFDLRGRATGKSPPAQPT